MASNILAFNQNSVHYQTEDQNSVHKLIENQAKNTITTVANFRQLHTNFRQLHTNFNHKLTNI